MRIRDLLLEENDGTMAMTSFAKNHNQRLFRNHPGRMSRTLENLSRHGMFVVGDDNSYISLTESEREKKQAAAAAIQASTIEVGQSKSTESKASSASYRYATQVRDLLLEENDGIMHMSSFAPKHRKRYSFPTIPKKRYGKIKKKLQKLSSLHGLFVVDASSEYIGLSELGKKEMPQQQQAAMTKSALSEADKHPVAAEKTPELSQCPTYLGAATNGGVGGGAIRTNATFKDDLSVLIRSEAAHQYATQVRQMLFEEKGGRMTISDFAQKHKKRYSNGRPYERGKMWKMLRNIGLQYDMFEVCRGHIRLSKSEKEKNQKMIQAIQRQKQRSKRIERPGEKDKGMFVVDDTRGCNRLSINEEETEACIQEAVTESVLSEADEHLVAATEMPKLSQCIALDSEFVPPRIALVNSEGVTIYDTYYTHGNAEPFFSGVRKAVSKCFTDPVSCVKMLFGTISVDRCRSDVAELIQGKVVVGHNVRRDLGALGLHHPNRLLRDTSLYGPFLDEDRRLRKLKVLAKEQLGVTIQEEGKPHCPAEDAWAAMELYKKHRGDWEAAVLRGNKHRKALASQVKDLIEDAGGKLALSAFAEKYREKTGERHPFPHRKPQSQSQTTAEQVMDSLGSEGGAISLDTFSAVYEQRYGKKPFAKKRRKNLEKLASTSGLFSVVCKTNDKNSCYLIDV